MRSIDCRTDENYNQRYLDTQDAEFLRGFDWCVERAADSFFDNFLDEEATSDTHIGHFLNTELPNPMKDEYEMEFTFPETYAQNREVNTYGDYLRMKLLEFIELERNELIISMLDNAASD